LFRKKNAIEVESLKLSWKWKNGALFARNLTAMDFNVLMGALVVVLHAMVLVKFGTFTAEKHVQPFIHQSQQIPNRAQNAV